jgi:hypothetical protein
MIFSVWAIRRTSFGWAVLAGVTILIAGLTKLSGLAYLVIPIAAFVLFNPATQPTKGRQVVALSYVPAVAGIVVLLLSLNSQNLFVYSTKAVDAQTAYWHLWSANSELAARWVTNLTTLPLIGLAVVGLLLTWVYRERAGLYLLVVPLAIAIPFIAVSKVWYPRYLMPVIPSLLMLAARPVDSLYQWLGHFPRTAAWRPIIVSVVVILVLLPAFFTDFWLLAEPPRAPLHAEERRQYIEGWPNTYGLAEAGDYVESLARHHEELYLAVNIDSFIVEEGLRYYFDRPANVEIAQYDPFSGYALLELNRWAMKRPTYLILNSSHEKGLNELQTNPELFVQGISQARL